MEKEEKLPTIKEMCEAYKEYRAEQDQVVGKMTEDEVLEYYKKQEEEAINYAKKLGLDIVTSDEGGND